MDDPRLPIAVPLGAVKLRPRLAPSGREVGSGCRVPSTLGASPWLLGRALVGSWRRPSTERRSRRWKGLTRSRSVSVEWCRCPSVGTRSSGRALLRLAYLRAHRQPRDGVTRTALGWQHADQDPMAAGPRGGDRGQGEGQRRCGRGHGGSAPVDRLPSGSPSHSRDRATDPDGGLTCRERSGLNGVGRPGRRRRHWARDAGPIDRAWSRSARTERPGNARPGGKVRRGHDFDGRELMQPGMHATQPRHARRPRQAVPRVPGFPWWSSVVERDVLGNAAGGPRDIPQCCRSAQGLATCRREEPGDLRPATILGPTARTPRWSVRRDHAA